MSHCRWNGFSVHSGLQLNNELQQAAVSGLIAGTVHGIVSSPLDLLHHSVKAKSGHRTLYRSLSHLVILRGVGHTLLRDGAGMMGYFSTYSIIRSWLSASLPQLVPREPCDTWQLALAEQVIPSLVAGGCAGVVYTFVSYPLDVIKTHWLQDLASASLSRAARKLVKTNGWRSLMSPKASLKRSFAPSALGLLAYEMFKANGMTETLSSTPFASHLTTSHMSQ